MRLIYATSPTCFLLFAFYFLGRAYLLTIRLRLPPVFLPSPSKNRPASLSGGSRLRHWLCSSLSAHLDDGGERQGLYFGFMCSL
jgi:hypothetical protein